MLKFGIDSLPEKIRGYVKNIYDGGTHLSALINQVLDLTKIETGKASVKIEHVSVREISDECLALMRPLATQQKVVLVDEISIKDTTYISADVVRLKQVIINLISNAIKYNKTDGKVFIKCRPVNGKIRFEIEDTGLGIPIAEQAEIFTPFSRAHHHINVEGSGIGLAVTKKNLEMMDSEIHFNSTEGVGSCFWFELDQADQVSDSFTAPTIPVNAVDEPLDIRVLYVEDNPIGMKLMEEIINYIPGVTLYKADSGEAGYRVAMEQRPDLIFLDINLPDISGLDVMKRLKQQAETSNTPVMALSASALESEVQKGLEAGFTRYIRKPCEADEIMAILSSQSRAIAQRPKAK
ncbi:MAG: response regulator [Gammaproteobacteria bacterium]|nr:response regulator [Gammaproteobacteria bacterium]